MATEVCDWRGVPIGPGAHVLYAGGQGTRAQVIEGHTREATGGPLLDARGRVFVTVTRRLIGNGTVGGSTTICVNPEHLTVLSGPLPATAAWTDEQAREIEREDMRQRKARERTHVINVAGVLGRFCRRCGVSGDRLAEVACSADKPL